MESISKNSDVNKSYYEFMLAKSWLSDGDETFINHAKELLEKGWNLNKQNEHGDTLLHLAVRNNKWKCLEWMIEQGGDCLIENKHGHSPVWLARRKNSKLFPLVFQEIYIEAQKNGLLVEKQTLINNNAPSSVDTSQEKYPNEKVVNQKEISVTDKWTDAFLNEDYKLAKQILFSDFDLKVLNSNGRTPLHEAINSNQWEMVEYLINYGACVSAKDNKGASCIDYVEKKWNEQEPSLDIDSYEMIKYALKDEKVADVLSKNLNIDTPSYNNVSKHSNKERNHNKKPYRQKEKINFVMDQGLKKVPNTRQIQEKIQETLEKPVMPVVIIKKTRRLTVK